MDLARQTTRTVSEIKTPSIEVECLSLFGKNIYVVRDDLLPGGTKQRGALDLIREFKNKGVTQIVYSSPFCGYAQIALAYSCNVLGLKCVIFCEEDKTPGSRSESFHPFSKQAQEYGATIVLSKDLPDAESKAEQFLVGKSRTVKIPLGFSCPSFYKHYKRALRKEWARLVSIIKTPPKKLWLPVGSGTLVNSFIEVLPDETSINAVNVHVLPDHDLRLLNLAQNKKVTFLNSPQKFYAPMKDVPPFPSNVFYDAKINHFIKSSGNDGDVWWNVAR